MSNKFFKLKLFPRLIFLCKFDDVGILVVVADFCCVLLLLLFIFIVNEGVLLLLLLLAPDIIFDVDGDELLDIARDIDDEDDDAVVGDLYTFKFGDLLVVFVDVVNNEGDG